MKNANENPGGAAPGCFAAQIDAAACSLCEVCARRCPKGALRRAVEGTVTAIYFAAERCDGCAGAPRCQKLCPEAAIRVSPSAQAASEEILLVQGEMQRCSKCGTLFAPVRRIEAAAKKGAASADLFHDICPLCRREDLVVRLIDDQRQAPGEEAEFRSGRDLMRKAGARSGRKTEPPKPPIV
ncbi:MAG: hypothetical protein HY812_08670 [Planctomycetes bacterium]|nr:hypothetical protein [Planctomycetota bacterium]